MRYQKSTRWVLGWCTVGSGLYNTTWVYGWYNVLAAGLVQDRLRVGTGPAEG